MREVDLAIVGAGVAGLTAATVAAQQGLDVLVIERMGAGGQVMNVERIDYSGHPGGVSGYELGPMLQEAAESAGVQFTLDSVERIEEGPVRHIVHCAGEAIASRAVLIAAGSQRRKLQVPGEEKLEGRGVSHCASCDGPLFRGQTVCVVGGGDSAFGEAAVLAAHASKVTMIFKGAQPHAQAHLVSAIAGLPNVECVAGAQVIEVTGDAGVTGVVIEQGDAPVRHLPAEGVFVYAGLVADAQFLADTVALDANGRITTDAHMATSVPGIFAAGDIRAGAAYLLGAAADEGAAAAKAVAQYLSNTNKNPQETSA